MKRRNKHILLGIIFGVFCTTIVFFLIGDIEIETEFKFGEKSTQEALTREKLKELLKAEGTSSEITFTPSDDSKEIKTLVIE